MLLLIFLARASFYAVPFLLAELLPSRLSVDYVLLQCVSLLPLCYLIFRQLLRLFLFFECVFMGCCRQAIMFRMSVLFARV